METQLKRFGLPNSNWELTDVNKDFQASNLSVSAQTASVVCIIGREHRRDFLILCMRLANVQYDKCFVCIEYLFSGMHTVMYQTPVKTGLCLFDVLVWWGVWKRPYHNVRNRNRPLRLDAVPSFSCTAYSHEFAQESAQHNSRPFWLVTILQADL